MPPEAAVAINNPIKGLNRILVFNGALTLLHEAEEQNHTQYRELIKAIDDVRYAESMLFAYDRDGKRPEDAVHGISAKTEDEPCKVRSGLRHISKEKRREILATLKDLNAPAELFSDQPKYENTLSWVERVSKWIESKGCDSRKNRRNGNGKGPKPTPKYPCPANKV